MSASPNRNNNDAERSVVREAFNGLAQDLNTTGPELWKIISSANQKSRENVSQGLGSTALDSVARHFGVERDVVQRVMQANGFEETKDSIRISNARLAQGTAPAEVASLKTAESAMTTPSMAQLLKENNFVLPDSLKKPSGPQTQSQTQGDSRHLAEARPAKAASALG